MAEKPATEEAAAAAPAAAKADAAPAHHVRVPDVVAALVDAPPREEPAGAAPSQQQQPKKKAAPSPAPAALKRTKSAPPQAMIKRKKSRSGPKSKSSSFIGVSQYRRTGRWEAHIWDCAKSQGTPGAKGRQLHLGSFDCAEDAARAYDRAAIHFRGANADTNYPREQYTHDPVLSALKDLSKEDFVIRLRGVAQHHKIQTQKKKGKPGAARGSAGGKGALARTKSLPASASQPSLHRTASYPLHSPHSVLPPQSHAGVGAAFHRHGADDYAGLMQVYQTHGVSTFQDEFGRLRTVRTVRLPHPCREQQQVVYRSRVLNGHAHGGHGGEVYHLHPEGVSDPPPKLSLPQPAAGAKAAADKDMHHFIDEAFLSFAAAEADPFHPGAEPSPPSHHHQSVKQEEGAAFRYSMAPPTILEDYPPHHLPLDDTAVETHGAAAFRHISGHGRPRAHPGTSQGLSAYDFDDHDFHWVRTKSPQEPHMPPLMEGMGEVDTGSAF
mmetsp:Transcript_4752/g.11982  ORF Transcript_4752/g.11982 Transcript_4752/m.11982 type:complete len:495 (+) Transcript_4752:447-1931(+)